MPIRHVTASFSHEKYFKGRAEFTLSRFLLPVLQLKHILQQPTAGEMRDALEQLPTDLYEAFEQTLKRVRLQPQGRRRIGVTTLTWLSQACRPLRLQELSEALAVRPKTSILDKTYCPSQQVIVEACKGLVIVDAATSAVHLIHYAVQEHLKAGHIDSSASVSPELGLLCVDYLSLDSVANGPLEDKIAILDRLAKNPFLDYACLNWIKHVRQSTDTNMRYKVMKLFKSLSKLQFIIQISIYLRGFREEYWCFDEVTSATPLLLACQIGLVDTIVELLDSGADIDATTSVCKHSPIHHAAANENHEILQLVLRAKPDIYRCNWYGTPLHCASEAGYCKNVELLLDAGLPVDIIDPNDGRTSLHCAVDMMRWPVVSLLQQRGAKMDFRDSFGRTSLHYVRGIPDSDSFQLLDGLRKTHPSARADFIRSFKCEEGFKLLLENNDWLRTQDSHGNTPLHIAALLDNTLWAKILISLGVDKQIRNMHGATAMDMFEADDAQAIADLSYF
ncbi:MAG: hypothetical protein LQ342_004468 [Letrouitia transgressa]|nr:MAG: hypothetical protein LQ342_004468 [Letrouitia transgressa]